MSYNRSKTLFFLFLLVLLFAGSVKANLLSDFDLDGVPDEDEINIFQTDHRSADTDGDGYSDWLELNYGYSPHNPDPVKLEDNDLDGDGLSDRLELSFKTNLSDPDSDQDGFSDGEEVMNGFDPGSAGAKLDKKIKVNLAEQELEYYLGPVRLGSFPVSSGANNTTPRGFFTIGSKHPKAWSSYGLWMPYWLGLENTRVGIHELPVWPNGYVEGEDHLGRPVSHGCIRLGQGPAEIIYNWAEPGTEVYIY